MDKEDVLLRAHLSGRQNALADRLEANEAAVQRLKEQVSPVVEILSGLPLNVRRKGLYLKFSTATLRAESRLERADCFVKSAGSLLERAVSHLNQAERGSLREAINDQSVGELEIIRAEESIEAARFLAGSAWAYLQAFVSARHNKTSSTGNKNAVAEFERLAFKFPEKSTSELLHEISQQPGREQGGIDESQARKRMKFVRAWRRAAAMTSRD